MKEIWVEWMCTNCGYRYILDRKADKKTIKMWCPQCKDLMTRDGV